jgi:D-alanyl-D-alanine dipeptidase
MTAGDERFVARWARAREMMAQFGMSLLLVSPGADFFYLLGQRGHVSKRMTLLAVPREGRPLLLAPALEAAGFAGWDAALDIRLWQDGDDPTVVLRQAVSPVSVRSIGVNDQMFSGFLLRLQETYRAASWFSAGPVLNGLRVIKDESELTIMREASRRTDLVWEAFTREPVAGLTEARAAARLTALLAEQGMPPSFDISVAAGPHGAAPHHEPGDHVIGAGDALVCDFGGILDGYCSDMTRTVHIGPPSDEFQRVYAVVQRAQEAAFRAVRPGGLCEQVDDVARGVIEAAGYGPHFIHRTGHGVGIDIHEEPFMVRGNRQPLRPGMVFSDEPGIYLPGKFGVRIEDLVVMTEAGGERLNQAPRDLQVLT